MRQVPSRAVTRLSLPCNPLWRVGGPSDRKSRLRAGAARGMIGLMEALAPSLLSPRGQPVVVFTRQELTRILSVYGQFVAAGERTDLKAGEKQPVDERGDGAVFERIKPGGERRFRPPRAGSATAVSTAQKVLEEVLEHRG